MSAPSISLGSSFAALQAVMATLTEVKNDPGTVIWGPTHLPSLGPAPVQSRTGSNGWWAEAHITRTAN
jgi:hypothetical protein